MKLEDLYTHLYTHTYHPAYKRTHIHTYMTLEYDLGSHDYYNYYNNGGVLIIGRLLSKANKTNST